MGGTDLQAQAVPPAVLSAARSALLHLSRDFPAFIRQVHPQLGLSYYESGRSINDDRALSRAQLEASWKSEKQDLKVESDYDTEKGAYITNAVSFLQGTVSKHEFLTSDDVRYNISGLPNSTERFHTAQPGELLVSFHMNETGNELGWSCLVLRLRSLKEKYYVSGIDYLYWIP